MSDVNINFDVKTEKLLVQQGIDVLSSHQSFSITETEWSELKISLDKRYTEIATLLRYNKTKDESIQRLSTEIQKYREGFAFSALKPFIYALIAMREDCRKSIRDIKQFAIDDEKVKKYIEYLISDIEEMLSNIGLKRKENLITINGKELSMSNTPKKISEENVIEDGKEDNSIVLTSNVEFKNISDLMEYLSLNETVIRKTIQDKSIVDKTIQEYITLSSRTDAEYYFALVAPVARQIYKLFDNVSAKSLTVVNYSDVELVKFYHAILDDVINGIEVILINAEITIETLDDVFDTQKHKLIKTIPTNVEKLDRTIANTYTDCYTYDGKVVYQSKVDVYKFQQINKGEENHG